MNTSNSSAQTDLVKLNFFPDGGVFEGSLVTKPTDLPAKFQSGDGRILEISGLPKRVIHHMDDMEDPGQVAYKIILSRLRPGSHPLKGNSGDHNANLNGFIDTDTNMNILGTAW
jgi:hypothetical protein